MAKLNVNIGLSVNDKTGDTLRTAFDKINQNFTELYAKPAYISTTSLKAIVAASTSFTDFQARIAAL
jgi:hypothetical protein